MWEKFCGKILPHANTAWTVNYLLLTVILSMGVFMDTATIKIEKEPVWNNETAYYVCLLAGSFLYWKVKMTEAKYLDIFLESGYLLLKPLSGD